MPAPMTTTRAAPGCVLKRTSSGRSARTVATVGRTAWSAILLSPAEPHPDRRTPRPLCLDRGVANVWRRVDGGTTVYLSRIRSALRSIFFFSLAVRLPFLTCCEARALAFRGVRLVGHRVLASRRADRSPTSARRCASWWSAQPSRLSFRPGCDLGVPAGRSEGSERQATGRCRFVSGAAVRSARPSKAVRYAAPDQCPRSQHP